MRMGDDTPGLGFAYEDLKRENNRLRAELAEVHFALTAWKETACDHRDALDRLRAELAAEQVAADNDRVWQHRADKAEAAIARVREVCMQDSWDIKLAGVGFLDVRLVLRALDGAE